MRRVLVCEMKQEVSTFNPLPSHASDFAIDEGDALFANHRDGDREVGGALDVFDASPHLQAVAGYGARALSSAGVLTADGFATLASGFLGAVEQHADVDGIYFALHGAMAVDGEDDPEGWLLARTREIVGPDLPVVVSMDLHGILTDRILTHADAVVTYHTYPHVDFRSTGARAAKVLERILVDGIQPVTAVVTVPVLVRGDELITATGFLGRLVDTCQEVEASPVGVSAGMFIGNPFTDVAALASHAMVVLDGADPDAPQQARRLALSLATRLWEARDLLRQPLVALDEAIGQAVDHYARGGGGTVVLTDAADATSSGASGDSNAILAALHRAGYQGRVLAPIVDAPAADAAFRAGVGARIEVDLGGTLDPARFVPHRFHGRVHMVSEGLFKSESDGMTWSSGRTAVLHGDHATVVVTSRSVSLYDRSLFHAHGQDPTTFDAVVVKSPHCQPHFFDAWAALKIHVDAPGSTSANLPSLGHTRCARPMFPLDDDVTFVPQARTYPRERDDAGARQTSTEETRP